MDRFAVLDRTQKTCAAAFEIIVVDNTSGLEVTVAVPGHVTELRVPPTFLMPGREYTIEVLGILGNGNKTITQSTFRTRS